MDYVYSEKIKADRGKKSRATGEQLPIYVILKCSVQKEEKYNKNLPQTEDTFICNI